MRNTVCFSGALLGSLLFAACGNASDVGKPAALSEQATRAALRAAGFGNQGDLWKVSGTETWSEKPHCLQTRDLLAYVHPKQLSTGIFHGDGTELTLIAKPPHDNQCGAIPEPKNRRFDYAVFSPTEADLIKSNAFIVGSGVTNDDLAKLRDAITSTQKCFQTIKDCPFQISIASSDWLKAHLVNVDPNNIGFVDKLSPSASEQVVSVVFNSDSEMRVAEMITNIGTPSMKVEITTFGP